MSSIYTGKVTSLKNAKTAVVEIVWNKPHPKYHKIIEVRKKIQAHNESFSLQLGDRVTIKNHRPYSATKRFLVISKES